MATRWRARPGTVLTPETYYPTPWKLVIGVCIAITLWVAASGHSSVNEGSKSEPARYTEVPR